MKPVTYTHVGSGLAFWAVTILLGGLNGCAALLVADALLWTGQLPLGVASFGDDLSGPRIGVIFFALLFLVLMICTVLLVRQSIKYRKQMSVKTRGLATALGAVLLIIGAAIIWKLTGIPGYQVFGVGAFGAVIVLVAMLWAPIWSHSLRSL